MVCLALRALQDSVRPRRLSGVVVRPLNFTVRGLGCFRSCFSASTNRFQRCLNHRFRPKSQLAGLRPL